MKKAFLFTILLLSSLAFSQNQAVRGNCTTGGQPVSLQGLVSTTLVQASYPGCTVTVYLTGTTTIASIYSNQAGTPIANPFTADATSGAWLFYATTGVGYDVVMSGGIAPNTFPSPVTLTDVIPGGGGGGSPPSPPSFSVQAANNGSAGFTSDSTITINPTLHSLNFGGNFNTSPTTPIISTSLTPNNPVAMQLGSAYQFYSNEFKYFSPSTSLPFASPNFQGFAATYYRFYPTSGGQYVGTPSVNSNIYCAVCVDQQNRTQGSNQSFFVESSNLGIGDILPIGGASYVYGGSGTRGNGLAVPTAEISEYHLSTGFRVPQFTASVATAPGATTINYTPVSSSDESVAAGARTIEDLTSIQTFTVTGISSTTVTTSGTTWTTANPSPVGQLIEIGATSEGSAPSYNGGGGTFTGFSNPGAVYAATVGNSGGTGYVTGNQVTASGCGSGDATFNVIASGGVVTSVSLATTPTGTSGYSLSSTNCTTSNVTGSGTGLTITITQVTGVVGSAGQSCGIINIAGGTGGVGGQLTILLTGTNTIANGTAPTGSSSAAIKIPTDNWKNATSGTLRNGTATCAGNVNLSGISGPCPGDQIMISTNGALACWGHRYKVTAVIDDTHLTTEVPIPLVGLNATQHLPQTSLMMQAVEASAIDVVNHQFTTTDTQASGYAWASHTLASPPDNRINAGGHRCIWSQNWLDGPAGAYASTCFTANSIGQGQINSAYTATGNPEGTPSGYGGFTNVLSGFNLLKGATIAYFPSDRFSGSGYSAPLSVFGGPYLDANSVSTPVGLNLAGGTFTAKTPSGGSQPTVTPGVILTATDSIAFVGTTLYTGTSNANIKGRPSAGFNTTLFGAGNYAPTLTGGQGLFSLIATDEVNNGFAIENTTNGIDLLGAFAATTGGAFHLWTAPASVLTDDAYAVTKFHAAVTAQAQVTSTVTTGTAPFVIASTTPVANLAATPTTYNSGGTQQTNTHIVVDKCTLGTSCSVTLTGSAVFTSSSSYQCTAADQTAAAAVKFAPSSGSAFVLTGTGTDVIGYICVGN